MQALYTNPVSSMTNTGCNPGDLGVEGCRVGLGVSGMAGGIGTGGRGSCFLLVECGELGTSVVQRRVRERTGESL